MKCPICKVDIHEGTPFCPSCGVKLVFEKSAKNISVFSKSDRKARRAKQKRRNFRLIIAGIVVLIIGVILLSVFINTVRKSELRGQLLKDWTKIEKSENKSYYSKTLDFTEEGTILFTYESPTEAEQEQQFTYRVVSPHKIIIDGKVYVIEFSGSKKQVMSVRPSISTADEEEIWLCVN